MKQQFRQNQLLLLEDIINVGKKGDIVTVKPGYARNFLLPQKKAVVVDKSTIRIQERLQEERAKQKEENRMESERIKNQIDGKSFSVQVKVDSEGHLYGSVSAQDIVDLLHKERCEVDKRFIRLSQPIKSLGKYTIPIKLKEGVEAQIHLQVESDQPLLTETQEEEKKELP
jgi:large subunit ribosomal protein L9